MCDLPDTVGWSERAAISKNAAQATDDRLSRDEREQVDDDDVVEEGRNTALRHRRAGGAVRGQPEHGRIKTR